MENETAKQALKRNTKKAHELIGQLKDNIEQRNKKAYENNVHWGHVGDIAHVIESLKNMIYDENGCLLSEIN